MSGRTFTKVKLLRRKPRMILTGHLIDDISQPGNCLLLAVGLHFCHLVIDINHTFLIFHLMRTMNMIKMTIVHHHL